MTCSKLQNLIRISSRSFRPLNSQLDALFTCSAYLEVFFGKEFTLPFVSARDPSVSGWQGGEEVWEEQKALGHTVNMPATLLSILHIGCHQELNWFLIFGVELCCWSFVLVYSLTRQLFDMDCPVGGDFQYLLWFDGCSKCTFFFNVQLLFPPGYGWHSVLY